MAHNKQELIDTYNWMYEKSCSTITEIYSECGTLQKAGESLGISHTLVRLWCLEEKHPARKRPTVRKVLAGIDPEELKKMSVRELADLTGWHYTWASRVRRELL